ncbi:MAG TPA: acyl-CoA desaturase [Acidimicrobiales bacterium]|jgi:linoleoyl-CoA desaturase|nr:acyl-CoA desaturase [Acidimicrobiales bacterium]
MTITTDLSPTAEPAELDGAELDTTELDAAALVSDRQLSSTAARLGLSAGDLEAFGAELDALRKSVLDDLGQSDVDYIRKVIKVQRSLAAGGRAVLFASFFPPAWLAGAAALSVSKILDNMEIGHNVMHGQYDWTRDPALSSKNFDWDTACPGDQWRHSHNYLHHTFTNIVGKDRDIGYGILRMSPDQKWTRAALANPAIAFALALMFEHGVMLHDVEAERVLSGDKPWREAWPTLRGGLHKTARQLVKDYVIWPLATGPISAGPTAAANLTANIVRNVWAFTIIFCGHFPDGTYEFSIEETEGESRGHWYFRQLLGSANITGSPLFHLMSGNLSHQIEHHLFTDLPAARYPKIAPQVQEICERYGLPYNSGPLRRQFGSVVRKICRLALR